MLLGREGLKTGKTLPRRAICWQNVAASCFLTLQGLQTCQHQPNPHIVFLFVLGESNTVKMAKARTKPMALIIRRS